MAVNVVPNIGTGFVKLLLRFFVYMCVYNKEFTYL